MTDQTETPNWPMLGDLRPGDVLIADGDFTCLDEGEECEVCERSNDGELYVHCREGGHFLAGQLNDAGRVVGFTKKDACT